MSLNASSPDGGPRILATLARHKPSPQRIADEKICTEENCVLSQRNWFSPKPKSNKKQSSEIYHLDARAPGPWTLKRFFRLQLESTTHPETNEIQNSTDGNPNEFQTHQGSASQYLLIKLFWIQCSLWCLAYTKVRCVSNKATARSSLEISGS